MQLKSVFCVLMEGEAPSEPLSAFPLIPWSVWVGVRWSRANWLLVTQTLFNILLTINQVFKF